MHTEAAARVWVEGWSRAWPARDADAIAELYARNALFYSHPFRAPQPPGEYAAWAFADQAEVVFRFGADGRVFEQRDAWASEPGRHELPDWAR